MFARSFVLTLLLFLGAAVAYLAGNGATPLFDRDEPRYALTSQNMLRTGDLIVPRQYDKPRTAKPPLIYWAQAAAMKLCGGATGFAARLPSSVAMLAVVALLFWFLFLETDPLTRLVSTSVFAFSGLTLFLAKIAITDATLLIFVAVSLAMVYRMWRGDRHWRVVITYGVATGLAMLTKGPLALGIHATTFAALGLLWLLDRKWPAPASWRTFRFDAAYLPRANATPRLKAAIATAIILAIALPWAILVERASPGFLTAAFRHDLVDRATRGVDGQARPPGFYFVVLYGTFFPWSLMLPATFVVAWKNRHRPLTRFCLAACIGPWIMFESSTSKMPHWFMPVFLPLSVLTGEAIARCVRGGFEELRNGAFRTTIGIWAAVVVALGIAPWFGIKKFDIPLWAAATLTIWTLTIASGGAWLFYKQRLLHAVALLSASMALLITVAFSAIFPHVRPLLLGREVGEALRAARPTSDARVIMNDSYNEPSVSFYEGGTAREADVKKFGDPFRRNDIDLLTCTESDFLSQDDDVQARWKPAAPPFKGLLYAKSAKPVTVLILAPAK